LRIPHNRRGFHIHFATDSEIRHTLLGGESDGSIRVPHFGFHRLQLRIARERCIEQLPVI